MLNINTSRILDFDLDPIFVAICPDALTHILHVYCNVIESDIADAQERLDKMVDEGKGEIFLQGDRRLRDQFQSQLTWAENQLNFLENL